ncbi:MAG: alkaline phosphatase family protein, partial [Solirubrobacterales bacterium]
TLARPNRRDDYSACVAPTLVTDDLFDFLLYSLPDNDYYSHKYGPTETDESIARADRALGALADSFGGIDEFLEQSGVIVMADHSQSDVDREVDLAAALEPAGRVLGPSEETVEEAELAVGLSSRSAGAWFLRTGAEGRRLHSKAVEILAETEGIDLASWLVDSSGEPIVRSGVGVPSGDGLVVRRGGSELRFGPGEGSRDRRGNRWRIEGDREVLELVADGEIVDSERYPNPFARLWAAHHSPFASDLQVSATLGDEFCDWGGASHVPGGSHGSLLAEDSLGPLLTVGLDGERPEREQWSIGDAHQLAANHFALGASR